MMPRRYRAFYRGLFSWDAAFTVAYCAILAGAGLGVLWLWERW